ncbi:MAG: DNA gyrase subunit B [Candidatus Micrarchaeota archaeon]|nr:DNA gyrase subunit B [Candidatus Micrarchaeota archaeon]
MQEEQDEYNASKILVLEGPQGIRKRPAMYIGSTSSAGALHLLFEVIDNSVDEALAGYAKNISITLTQDETGDIGEVTDDGRGIPVDIMPKFGKSAVEVIMTTLHKGAKFNNDTYKISGGLHGVGLTVVNALSEFTSVSVAKDGKLYRQTFSKGVPSSTLTTLGMTQENGTTVKFKPDPEIFPTPKFDSAQLKDRLRYLSFLNPRLRIKLTDNRFNAHEEETFFSEKGMEDFLRYINKDQQGITSIMHDRRQEAGMVIEFAIQYISSYDERLEAFVNNIRTAEGGTHVVGFHSGLSRAIINYLTRNNKNGVKVSGDDTREGLAAIISVLMPNPEFEGQTKEKLGNSIVKNIVETSVYSYLSRYFEEHPAEAKAVMEKAIGAMNARESARRARDLARKKNIFESAVLPGKLADCIEDDPERTELFIVEGKSAGGSSKEGRDKQIQAILPLRGKILNVEKASEDRIFESAELNVLVTALGTGIKESFNPEKTRYKKIVIMSDADVDGEHIRTLLLTFFYRYMKKLIESGYVYIAQPPLYKVTAGRSVSYCYTDEELEAKRAELDGKMEVQRYKGLGEMNAEQLWDTTMNPTNRMLKRVGISDAERANSLFSILMGVDVHQRRKFLEEHSGDVRFLDI